MRILVNEEDGYRHWIWNPSVDNKDELVEWWNTNMTPEFVDEFVFYDITEMEGDWIELDSLDCRMDEEYDGYAAVHTSENTSLRLDKDKYLIEDAEHPDDA